VVRPMRSLRLDMVGRSENESRRTPLDVQPVGDKKRQRGVAATQLPRGVAATQLPRGVAATGSIRSKAVWRSQIEDSPTFKLTN